MSLGSWVQQARATYTSNATATRDFRVQLRGNRSILLFALYLGILILIGGLVYWQTAGNTTISVVDAQRRLQDFYQVVMILLGSMIALVSPALTATSVVLERQRKSLDLVFSAPVSPRYFLVGKMIASYRYTWMLLVLSLPVTATCVVLGGASWSDVLVSYLLLSFHALLFTSIGLLMSTVAQKAVSAIVWSYAVTGMLLMFTAPFAAVTMFPGGTSREASFLVGTSPFFVIQAADTYTMIGTLEVPNFILAGVVILLFCKLALLTAGALLAPPYSKEVPSLRIHVLAYTFALALYAGYGFASSAGTGMGIGSGRADASSMLGIMTFWALSPLFIFVPLLACFGTDAERRYLPDGVFNWRQAFDGKPSGALPYILMVIASLSLGMVAGGFLANSSLPEPVYLSYLVFCLGFWVFFWATARLCSAFMFGLRTARTMQFAAFLIVVVMPVPILSAVAAYEGYGPDTPYAWEFYVLRPMFSDGDRHLQALGYGAALLLIGYRMAVYAEKLMKKRMAPRLPNHAGNFRPT